MRYTTIHLIYFIVVVLFLLFPFPATASNTISSNSSNNATSFELTSSSWYQPNVASLTIGTSAGTTIIIGSVEARMNSTGAKLLGRILRDGVEIGRANLTELTYIANLPIIAIRNNETEGTHTYALELLNPAGKKTFVNSWTLGVTYVANGEYITEGITNSTALINVTQVNGLRGEQDAQNTSTSNLQYNSTIYNSKFDNVNTTTDSLKGNDTTHDVKFDNQNSTNTELSANDTSDRAYLNNSFPGSTYLTTLGTIITAVYHGTAIDDAYIVSSALWNSYTGKIEALNTSANSSSYNDSIHNVKFDNQNSTNSAVQGQQDAQNYSITIIQGVDTSQNLSISTLQQNDTAHDQKFDNVNSSLNYLNVSVNNSFYNDTVHDIKFNNVNTSLDNIVANNTAQANYDNTTFSTIVTTNAMNSSSASNASYSNYSINLLQLELDAINTSNAANDTASRANDTKYQSVLDTLNSSAAVLTITDAMNASSHYNRTILQGELDSVNNTVAGKININTADQMNLSSSINRTYFQALNDLQNLTNAYFNLTNAGQDINNTLFNATDSELQVNDSKINGTIIKIIANNTAKEVYNNQTFVNMSNESYVKTNNASYVKTNNISYLQTTKVIGGTNTTVLDNGDGTITISSSGSRLEKVEWFTGDGITTNFTTSQSIQATTSRVHVNGIEQREGVLGAYTEHPTFIEFASAPPQYDAIEVEYV